LPCRAQASRTISVPWRGREAHVGPEGRLQRSQFVDRRGDKCVDAAHEFVDDLAVEDAARV
jgi:hypothetical protein